MNSKSPLNIAIVGGGIGGLATAIALLNQRFNVQVYERTQALQPIGAGLSLMPNGLNCLDAIHPGIVNKLKQAGSQNSQFNLKKSTGEAIASQPSKMMQQYGQPMVNIRWSRLQEILAEALPADIIHLNCRCIGFEQSDRHVKVNFADRNSVEADLLIGADGLNSVVRQVLFDDGSPIYQGRMSWRAVVKYDLEVLPPNEIVLFSSAEGKNFLLVDVGEGYIFWSAGALAPDDAVCQNAAEVKSRVLTEFAGWAEPLQEIINITPGDRIVERPICDRVPLQSWSSGRVTLLGDAAHPIVPALGQGANTAFEDAWELSQCLAQGSTITDAFHAYEQSRIPRTQVIYARSAYQGHRAYKPDSEATFRNIMQPQASQAEFEEWLFRYQPVLRRV